MGFIFLRAVDSSRLRFRVRSVTAFFAVEWSAGATNESAAAVSILAVFFARGFRGGLSMFASSRSGGEKASSIAWKIIEATFDIGTWHDVRWLLRSRPRRDRRFGSFSFFFRFPSSGLLSSSSLIISTGQLELHLPLMQGSRQYLPCLSYFFNVARVCHPEPSNLKLCKGSPRARNGSTRGQVY